MNENFISSLVNIASISDANASPLLYLIAGVIPCLIWLAFYLFQDHHPEPKNEILSVFALGAVMTWPTVWIEIWLINIIDSLGLPSLISIFISNIIAIALVEEFFKYAAVWIKEQVISQNYHLDEPVDFVIYMVVSALGFAAVENLLFLLMPSPIPLITRSFARSITAIILHTLCSGILGYYMAMTFCHRKKRLNLLLTGFVTVSFLHGLYNFSIMKSETEPEFLLAALAIILFMACALYIKFERLLKMKSVCDMK